MAQSKQPKRKRVEEMEGTANAGANTETQTPPRKTLKTSESDLNDSKDGSIYGMCP